MRLGLVVCASIVVGLLVAGRLARGQDAAAGDMQTVTTEDEYVTFNLPATWTVTRSGGAGLGKGAWAVTLPDGAGSVVMTLVTENGTRDERLGTAQILWETDAQAKANTNPKLKIETKLGLQPIPYAFVSVSYGERQGKEFCSTVRVVKRRGFRLAMQGDKESVDAALPAFLAGAAKLDTSRTEFPDVPETYKRVLRDGYEYCLSPNVKEADVAKLHARLLAQEAAYVRRCGPVPKPANSPILVVLHSDAADAAAGAKAGMQWMDGAKDGLLGAPVEGALCALAPSKDDPATAGLVAQCFAFVLHSQTFGTGTGAWHLGGDATLARVEAVTGKPLPDIAASMTGDVPATLLPLKDLVAKETLTQPETFQVMVYMALFRSAKPWADAFAAYAKAVREGAEPKAACEKTLLALDQDKLRAAAEAYAKTFRPLKGR
jgi:hypothetical protein